LAPVLAAMSPALWLYLLLGRRRFWPARPRIENEAPPEPGSWPAVSLTEHDCLALGAAYNGWQAFMRSLQPLIAQGIAL
jgi:hypothetical protein